MRESAVNKIPENKIGESEKQDYQTPDIYEISSLGIDSRLPKLKINSTKDTLYTDSTRIQLVVELPHGITGADIFLFRNGKKDDMYYQAVAGEYLFRNIFLEDTVNNIIFLYRLGNRRSLPTRLVVIKGTGG